MSSKSEFQLAIAPLKNLSAWLLLRSCFKVQKSSLQHVASIVLTVNWVVLYLEFMCFICHFSKEGNLPSTIITTSLLAMHCFCSFCGYFFIKNSTEFQRMLSWCEGRKKRDNLKTVKAVLTAFIGVNLILVAAIFVGTLMMKGKVETAFPIHLPFLTSDTYLKYLVNALHQALGSLYTISQSVCFLSGIFLTLRYIFLEIDSLIERTGDGNFKSLIDDHVEVIEMFQLVVKVSSKPFMALLFVIFPSAFLGWFGFTIAVKIRVLGVASSLMVAQFFTYFFINELMIAKVSGSGKRVISLHLNYF